MRSQWGVEDLMVEVAYHLDATKTYTTATLVAKVGGQDAVGVGTAKRNPGDDYVRSTGARLALKRALRDLADDIEVPGE